MDVIDPATLLNDGMPRVSPPRPPPHGTTDATTGHHDTMMMTMAKHVQIEIHGSATTLFEETDVFRVTHKPSSAPSSYPSSMPSSSPSGAPSGMSSGTPTESVPPTYAPTAEPTPMPTSAPTYAEAYVPRNPRSGYFNYDPSGPYGPRRWKNVDGIEEGDPGYFWHTFDLEDSKRVSNDCGSGRKQSPIDVCTKPRDSCTETHEMRPKSGDYKMDGHFITKQILPNKLRLIMAPRTGEEPDPPQIDFSSNGRGIIDMTNIDIKFPSEHTVCGHSFDGEMQYFTYHPARKRFVAVSFFLDGSETNPKNEHMQEVIDAFTIQYKEDEMKCKQRQTSSLAGGFAFGGGGRRLYGHDDKESILQGDEQTESPSFNTTILESDQDNVAGLRQSHRQRRLALKWHPFHPDVQKTVHFWGYGGSFTEPPCTSDSIDWKIMDVPTPISSTQLAQLKHILFTHVDKNCRRTSVHNAKGSVARPTQDGSKYYKCTRDDYVSDEERAVCGDAGCVNPFGSGLNRYYPPLVDVTGPPTRSPSK